MNIGEALPRNAQHYPHKTAIVDSRRSLTFLDLHLRTNRLGNYLLQRGINKGDIVGISCGSRAEHFETLFALAKIGAIAVPYDYHWSTKECEAMIRFFRPRGFVVEERQETEKLVRILEQNVAPDLLLVVDVAKLRGGTAYTEAVNSGSPDEPRAEVNGTDPFLIMITSGTTGFPKACSINHDTYSLRSLNYAVTRGFGHHERALLTLPVHFNAGRGAIMSLLYLGGTVFIQEKFDERLFLKTIQDDKITYTILVPTLCDRLLRSGLLPRFDTSSLAYIGITGGHLSADSAQGIMNGLSAKLYEAYASTDSGQITLLSPQDRHLHGDSVGRPIWCVLLKFLDENGKPVATGEKGEICVRTPLAIQEYYRNPAATNAFVQDGWCHTGDIGFLDAQGYLHVSGRKKTMVKSGGISVFPEEIEETLRGHVNVADVAVVGVHSAEWGEAAKAFVVLKQGTACDAASLINFCKESLAPYKAPKFVEFVSTLPRTGLGKIDRAKLEEIVKSREG